MATTLAQLRLEFEVLFDVAGSTVLSSAEKNTLANAGYRSLWAEVTSVNKWFRTSVDGPFTITTGQIRALPSTYQETVAVRLNPGTDQMVYLNRYGPRTGSQMYTRTYRLDGVNLVIEPLQRAPGTYDHVYIPQPPALVADADQLDVELDQWRRFIVYHMLLEALAREESELGEFQLLMYGTPDGTVPGVKRELKQWAASQRSADPNMIENVRTYTPWAWTTP